MDKKIALIALAVVAIVVIAAVAYVFWPTDENPDEKVIYWTQVPPKDQQAAFVAGSIDGGVSWEPYCSDSIVAGDAHVIKWSGEIWPNHPCCVLAIKTSFLNANPDLAARMTRAHMDANQWVLDALANPSSANFTLLMEMGASFSGRTTDVVAASCEHIKFSYELTSDVLDGFEQFTQMFIDLNQTSLGSYPDVGAFVSDLVDTSVITAAMACSLLRRSWGRSTWATWPATSINSRGWWR